MISVWKKKRFRSSVVKKITIHYPSIKPFYAIPCRICHEIHHPLYGNIRFITMFTRATPGSYPEPGESSPHPHILFLQVSVYY